ncbi:MAG: hypothetical protein ACLVG6_13790 [Dorea formicigenerans]
MKTISRIAYSNDKRNRTRSILIMMAICLTTMLLVIISTVGNGVIHLQKSQAARIIWEQLWSVCFRRRIAVKRSKPPCGNRCYRHYVHRRYHKRQ